MSIVPGTGVLRKLYEDALEDSNPHPSSFWQIWLQRAFLESDAYSVTFGEQQQLLDHPDASIEDIVVNRFRSTNNSTEAVLWVGCVGTASKVGEAEEDALAAAKHFVEENGLPWIYAMTTVGGSFRIWHLEPFVDELQPVHGTAVSADLTQYIRADSRQAWVLMKTVNWIMTNQKPISAA